MIQGLLFFDKKNERYDIIFQNGKYQGGLKCGDSFETLIEKDWISVEIEKVADSWHFKSCDGSKLPERLNGMTVRMGS